MSGPGHEPGDPRGHRGRPCITRRSRRFLEESADAERAPRTLPVSHHISGPRAVAEPIADITDLYAFPSPERHGCLVLVLNTLPFAPPTARLRAALIYRFRLRKLTPNGGGPQAPFSPADDEFVSTASSPRPIPRKAGSSTAPARCQAETPRPSR